MASPYLREFTSALGDYFNYKQNKVDLEEAENREWDMFQKKQAFLQKLQEEYENRKISQWVLDKDEQGQPVYRGLNAMGEMVGQRVATAAEMEEYQYGKDTRDADLKKKKWESTTGLTLEEQKAADDRLNSASSRGLQGAQSALLGKQGQIVDAQLSGKLPMGKGDGDGYYPPQRDAAEAEGQIQAAIREGIQLKSDPVKAKDPRGAQAVEVFEQFASEYNRVRALPPSREKELELQRLAQQRPTNPFAAIK
jgi:hypothetical protein